MTTQTAKKRAEYELQHTEQTNIDALVFNLVDALQAPILTFSMSWADTIPKRFLDILPIARMIALKKGEELATYPEIAVYIYTRSLDAPMPSEWVDIYTHVTCRTLQDHFNEDHWDQVNAPKKLSDWLQSKLNDLRKHIYNKRREILKKRLKQSKPVDTKAQSNHPINNSSKKSKAKEATSKNNIGKSQTHISPIVSLKIDFNSFNRSKHNH